MIPYEEALSAVLSHTQPLAETKMTLEDALGHALAQEVAARFDMPAFDNSAMDGFGVRALSWVAHRLTPEKAPWVEISPAKFPHVNISKTKFSLQEYDTTISPFWQGAILTKMKPVYICVHLWFQLCRFSCAIKGNIKVRVAEQPDRRS